MPGTRKTSRLERLMDDIEHAIRSQDEGVQSDLVRESAEVLVKTWSSLPTERRAGFDGLLHMLLRQVNTLAKREFAERLAVLRRGPAHTLRLLAEDSAIEVSRPLLEDCRSFEPETLVALARMGTDQQRSALARRVDLCLPLADALAECGGRSAALIVLANPAARFSDLGFRHLIELARSSEAIAVYLAPRPDLPAQHRPELALMARRRVDGVLEGDLDDRAAAERFLSAVSATFAAPVTENRVGRFMASVDFVASEAKPATAAQIERWIALRRIEDVLAAIAHQANLSVDIVVGAYDATDSTALAAILRGLQFPWSTLKTLLQSRHGRDLPIEALAGGYDTYKTVSPLAARRSIRWGAASKRQGPFRAWDDDHADAGVALVPEPA